MMLKLKLKYIIPAIMLAFITCTNTTYAQDDIIFIQNEDIEITKDTTEEPVSKVFTPLILDNNEVVFNTSQRKIVEDNTVVAISGADSTIPKNGVVISGHGLAKNWITQNITVGSKIYVDIMNKTLTVYTTSESYTYEARKKIEEVQAMIAYCHNLYPKYNSTIPEKHIETAQNYLKLAQNDNQNPLSVKQYTQQAIDAANMAIKTTLPYVSTELKGTWIRPTEINEEQIKSTLDNIKANGFNSIFLETYYHGKTIFPSKTMNKYGFTVQNEIFEGFDPLKIWISEAHKRNIKVHIWFQTFYVGNQPAYLDESSILSVRPDWGNKTKTYADVAGATKSVSEHNGYFIDPANPEVQEFLLELLEEIITSYNPDGINLDYIRYPNSNGNSDKSSWGYTEYARNDFQQNYGVDPIELTPSDVGWYDWNCYRRNNISEFVRKAGSLGREKKVYVSAVIFPDIASALSTKQQDWRSWSLNRYIDGFTPLFLTYDYQMLASMMNDVLRVKSPSTDLFAGLFVTFMGGAPEDLIRQIYQTRIMQSNGIIIFDWAHTTGQYTSTLMASAFNSGVKSHGITVAQKQKKKWFKRKKEKNKDKQQAES